MVSACSLEVENGPAEAEDPLRRNGRGSMPGEQQGRRLDWRTAAAAGVCSAGLAVVASIGVARSAVHRYALLVLLWTYTALLLAAAALARWWPRPLPAPRLNLGGRAVFGAFSLMLAQLVVRLLSDGHFGGNAANFDFGIKCSKKPADPNKSSDNLAFKGGFNDFMHFLQGCFSFLLFPVAEALLLHCVRQSSRQVTALAVKDVVALFVVFYPSYNVTKRAVKTFEFFSKSSFPNNGWEWASGVIFGACAAPLATVACGAAGKDWEADLDNAHERMECPRLVRLRLVAAGILLATSMASAFMLWFSWNNLTCP